MTETNEAPIVEEEPHVVANADGVIIRPALEVLSQLRRGQVMDLLSIEMNRVVNGVAECASGKGGSVTLTLKIAPLRQHANAIAIQATIVGKAPEDPPESDLLFYDEDGNLHARNPNQGDIFEDGPQGV